MNKDAPDANDGFDLIEYPCDFAIKAMYRTDACPGEPAELMENLLLQLLPREAILARSSNHSRTGKFESVTITARLASRQQLEAIYQALADDENILMTL